METLKNIFVSCEMAKNLKEIGFDEPCIAVYSKGKLNIFDPNDSVQWVMFEGDFFVPTWEQVKKWFREKEIIANVFKEPHSNKWAFNTNKSKFEIPKSFSTYEEAREQLIYKLIEIYENGK